MKLNFGVLLLCVCGIWEFKGDCARTAFAEQITPSVFVERGPINLVSIKREGLAAVYGTADDPSHYQTVFLTHHRRDVVWAARAAADAGIPIVAPLAERDLMERPAEFWSKFKTSRFHDYGQQSTKVVASPVKVTTWVAGHQTVRWNGIDFKVLDTPGYTRGAVSYVTKLDGKTIAFVGDIIYGDGQIFDLFSFQDAIPTARIGGYHGYGSRLAPLIQSLETVAAEQPDVLIPARGPVIHNPQAAIAKLIRRVRAVYANYLSTNALNWDFKAERMTTAGRRVLGENANVTLMPYSLHMKTPDWIWENSTSRLLISDDGHGFLLDCGNQRVIDGVKQLIAMKLVKQVEGIFVTHYHDDHTDKVQQAAEEFGCPVYATPEYKDILENPGAYHMPAMTSNAIKNVKAMQHGQTVKWHEFDLTYHFYPGQCYYHGAMLVKKQGETPVFFIGDAFSPSGIDDYCVLNRNLIHKDAGYFLCLKRIRELKAANKGEYWLINEHIPYVFRFSDRELDYLESEYAKRKTLLAELFPWDDPNYGIDEQWAFFYPHAVTAKPSSRIELQVRLENHSSKRRAYEVALRLPKGVTAKVSRRTITLDARGRGSVTFTVEVPAMHGDYVITADVQSDWIDVRDWVEAVVSVDEVLRNKSFNADLRSP